MNTLELKDLEIKDDFTIINGKNLKLYSQMQKKEEVLIEIQKRELEN